MIVRHRALILALAAILFGCSIPARAEINFEQRLQDKYKEIDASRASEEQKDEQRRQALAVITKVSETINQQNSEFQTARGRLRKVGNLDGLDQTRLKKNAADLEKIADEHPWIMANGAANESRTGVNALAAAKARIDEQRKNPTMSASSKGAFDALHDINRVVGAITR